ncbi:predicted protein [Chaetoceros tenuissimus]|uniref:Uncharacterized protein n=1 Tax=Chaetoceros tenuissimus TaxID=426638 RepID=A0AAD3DAK7_9STRA|nr:predicted protein [Chaetoceros tenuissimus]
MNDFMKLDYGLDLFAKLRSLSSDQFYQERLEDIQKLRGHIQILNQLKSDGKWEDEEFWGNLQEFVSCRLEEIPEGAGFFNDNIRDPLYELADIVHESMTKMICSRHYCSNEDFCKLAKQFSDDFWEFENVCACDENYEPLICVAANHAGIAPEYLSLLLEIEPLRYWGKPFLLRLVTSHESDGVAADENRVNALKELVKLGLLKKKHVSRTRTDNENLLVDCDVRFTKVFDFLSSFDPDSLFTIWESFGDIEKTTQFLEAGFNHFPNVGGLLFHKNEDGKTTVLDKAFEIYGKKKVMEILRKILSPKSDYPILHHIFSKAPQYKDLFSEKFGWAHGILRDHNGRTLHQAVLAAGPMIVKKNAVLFTQLQDSQILEKDPITTLFPFAAMAVGEHGDLHKCFELLRRQPSVLERKARMKGCTLKRKRE